MTYRIPLPDGGARDSLDVVDPFSSMVQRFLRREGLAHYEPETAATLLTLFDIQSGPFVLFDVGANIGLYSHLCAAMFSRSRVQSFEPTPEIAAICRAIAKANDLDVDVVEAAVSDSAGTASLHLSSTSDASNSLVAGFKQARGSVEVARITLDEHRAATGISPTVLKIDVETHEPAVLAGASELLAQERPFVVIEVLKRRGGDQGPEIQAAFDALGYSYYRLSDVPDWTPSDRIRGSGTVERDWLLAPEPLPADFGKRWSDWRERLSACTTDRNPRPPMGGAAAAAYHRGGLTEVWSSARRFLSEDLLKRRSRPPGDDTS